MKAVVCTKYGAPEVLKIKDVEKPQPNEKEVLIKIYASSVQTGDWRVRSLTLPKGFKTICKLVFGWNSPRQPILGTELSGVIESVGAAVTKFSPGEHVLAVTGAKFGAHAQYICLPESGKIVKKPETLSFQEAATLSFGGVTALDYLRNKGHIKSGDKVLVNGASGAVGVAAVQLAKFFEAEVTAVCSEANFALMKSLKADTLIDYTKEDFRNRPEKYDIILDTTGNLTYPNAKSHLAEHGRLLLVSSELSEMLRAPWINLTSSQKIVIGVANENIDLLNEIVELADQGKFKAVIDRQFPLEQAVEAHAYVEARHKKGNVVLFPV